MVDITLNAFGKIPQIEHVMGFCWRRQQVGVHAVVDLHRREDDVFRARFYGLGKIGEEPGENRRENLLQTDLAGCRNGKHCEMT